MILQLTPVPIQDHLRTFLKRKEAANCNFLLKTAEAKTVKFTLFQATNIKVNFHLPGWKRFHPNIAGIPHPKVVAFVNSRSKVILPGRCYSILYVNDSFLYVNGRILTNQPLINSRSYVAGVVRYCKAGWFNKRNGTTQREFFNPR